ncbi:MAG: hypothetical protein IID44_19735 [Planctomycetes bacterium]|nr:hypothetical protein [Planctomycetota bacterium]
MIDHQLAKQLDPVASRIRLSRLGIALAAVWLVAAAAGAAVLMLGRDRGWELTSMVPVLAIAALSAASLFGWLAMRSAGNYTALAQRIEAKFPDLNAALLTAVEQQPALPDGRYGFLQDHVLRTAFYHSQHHRWRRAAPMWRMVAAHTANVAGCVLLVGVLVGLATTTAAIVAEPEGLDFASVAVPVAAEFAAAIEPGNTEIERGTSLLVLARFKGHLPPGATLLYTTADGEQRRLGMSKSLDDPVFGARIASVQQPLTYRVEFERQTSDEYHATVFDFPQLTRADVKLEYPSYTHKEDRLIQDVRIVSAVEGTDVTLICHVNKPLDDARLVEAGDADEEAEPLKLENTSAEPLVYRVTLKLDRSRRLKLHLIDDEGRRNKTPPEFVLNMLPNRPPDLKLVLPARDVQVSPIEELEVMASVWDDFGLSRVGMSFAMAGTPATEIVLASSLAAKERTPLVHLLAFEDLKAQPDQLLSYYFWAEDVGPDGKTRRTMSDMYFAEVRHFEEIFRQGQQPPGSQQQQQQKKGNSPAGQQAEKLAELQKQIINGTWKVIRRETRKRPTEKFDGDVTLLGESQASALEQVDALAEKVKDAQSLAHVADVRRHMQAAATQLEEAGDGPAIEALQPALAAEQAAYQALLRLRAREHQVIRSQQQQSGQSQSARKSSSSRAQQQLRQLQLKDEKNRYETQQTAQPKQSQEQREDRQVLNRLRELAQRQNDLNKRIKELQTALEEAQTQQEQEDIERRLKRLRDEQQQILRDTEKLQERMERPENQERMAEQRQQLDKVRENVRRSSEALKAGQVSRAAAEGTRAERELRELRDEFQKRTSGQFTQQMREMRRQARELDEKEKKLGEQLAELDQPTKKTKSLRGSENREEVAKEIDRQRQNVEDLLERMRKTVEEAEESEPLLAEELYEAIRNTRRQNPEKALESAGRSLDRGLLDDARNEERQAGKGIAELRKGVDRAAEKVLGDEAEALRRAQQELERLNRELRDEIARANGQQPGKTPDQPPRQGTSPKPQGKNQPGQEQPGQQPGQKPGQQPGQKQPGQKQPGQQSGQQPGQRPGSPSAQAGGPGGGNVDLERFLGGDRPPSPIGGEDFLDWSDRLRDIEEMIADPELRAEAARIRDRAKAIRKDVKRHSKPPNWNLVKVDVADPLIELQNRVAEELLRRSNKDSLVPIDRDPVPARFREQVRRYYERLGSGK